MKERIYRAVLTLAFTLSLLTLHAGMASAESLRFTGSPHFLPAPLMVVGVYTPDGQANFAPFHRGGVLASGKDGGPMRIGFGIKGSSIYHLLKRGRLGSSIVRKTNINYSEIMDG